MRKCKHNWHVISKILGVFTVEILFICSECHSIKEVKMRNDEKKKVTSE
jgi:hypothetical protein